MGLVALAALTSTISLLEVVVSYFIDEHEMARPKATLLITLGAGWFNYGAWRFFMRFVAPVAVAAILVAVIFFGVDFS